MEVLNDLTQSIASEISSQESRSRKRSADAQNKFEYAIETILKDLWKASAISTEHECGINQYRYAQTGDLRASERGLGSLV